MSKLKCQIKSKAQMSNEKSARKNEMMEHWNIGFRKNIFTFEHSSIIPKFHLSGILSG